MTRPRLSPVLALALLVVASGCGSRLPRDEIVSAVTPGGVRSTAAEPSGPATSDAPAAEAATGEQSDTTPVAAVGSPAGVTGETAPVRVAGSATPAASTVSASGGAGVAAPNPVIKGRPAAPGQSAPNPAPGAPVPATGIELAPVVIGNIGEYSGPVATSAGGGRPMAMVVARWLNANGGLNGHQVKMVVADNAGDPSRYLALAKGMVEKDGAIAFMGNQVPLTAPGADAYLREKGVPVIGGDGAHGLWFTSPVMFFPGTDWQDSWLGAAKLAAQQGKTKLAMFYCVEAEPCQTANAAYSDQKRTQRAGVQVVYRAQISIAQPDFTSECLQAKSNGAEVVAMSMDASSMSRVARSCVAQGYRPLFLTLGLGVVESLTKDPNLENIVASSSSFPWMVTDTPGARAFHDAIRTYNPAMEESGAAAQVWVAGMVLKEVGSALGATPTSTDLMKALWAITDNDFGGLAPKVSFPQGKPRPAIECFFSLSLTGGKWVAPQGSQRTCL